MQVVFSFLQVERLNMMVVIVTRLRILREHIGQQLGIMAIKLIILCSMALVLLDMNRFNVEQDIMFVLFTLLMQ